MVLLPYQSSTTPTGASGWQGPAGIVRKATLTLVTSSLRSAQQRAPASSAGVIKRVFPRLHSHSHGPGRGPDSPNKMLYSQQIVRMERCEAADARLKGTGARDSSNSYWLRTRGPRYHRAHPARDARLDLPDTGAGHPERLLSAAQTAARLGQKAAGRGSGPAQGQARAEAVIRCRPRTNRPTMEKQPPRAAPPELCWTASPCTAHGSTT